MRFISCWLSRVGRAGDARRERERGSLGLAWLLCLHQIDSYFVAPSRCYHPNRVIVCVPVGKVGAVWTIALPFPSGFSEGGYSFISICDLIAWRQWDIQLNPSLHICICFQMFVWYLLSFLLHFLRSLSYVLVHVLITNLWWLRAYASLFKVGAQTVFVYNCRIVNFVMFLCSCVFFLSPIALILWHANVLLCPVPPPLAISYKADVPTQTLTLPSSATTAPYIPCKEGCIDGQCDTATGCCANCSIGYILRDSCNCTEGKSFCTRSHPPVLCIHQYMY